MANTRFTVKCVATGGEFFYYGANCPREGEWIAFGDMRYQVICVTHVPHARYVMGEWEDITIDVGEGRAVQ